MTNEERLERVASLAEALRLAILNKRDVPHFNIISVCNIIEMHCKFPSEHMGMAQVMFNREMNALSENPDPDQPQ